MKYESLAVFDLAFVGFAVVTLVEGCRMCRKKIDNSPPSAVRQGIETASVGTEILPLHLPLLSYVAYLRLPSSKKTGRNKAKS